MNIATVSCRHCGTPTPMLGTRECDRCHELWTRIDRDPGLARRALAEHDARMAEAPGPNTPRNPSWYDHDVTIDGVPYHVSWREPDGPCGVPVGALTDAQIDALEGEHLSVTHLANDDYEVEGARRFARAVLAAAGVLEVRHDTKRKDTP